MTAWTAVAGSATSWLLVLVLGMGAGYAMVLSWSRWGGLLPVPTPAAVVIGRLLGPAEASGRSASESDAPAPAEAPPTVLEETAEVVQTSAPVRPVAEVTEPPPAQHPEADDEGPGPDTAGESSSLTDPPLQTGHDAAPEDADPQPARSGRTLARTDALTELGKVLGLEYEDAAALLDHGLWGFENFDEWTRSMRGHARPADISEAAWEKVLQVDWRVLAPTVDAHREKHAAMQRLEELWGVGPDEAEALYTAGYRDLPSIRKVSTEALAKVPGIGAARAFQIRAAAHGLAPSP